MSTETRQRKANRSIQFYCVYLSISIPFTQKCLKMKNKTSFKTKKKDLKFRKLSKTMKLFAKNRAKLQAIKHDHSYAAYSSRVKQQKSSSYDGWKIGRRVVELAVLAEGLRSCKGCGERLNIEDAVNESKFGLGGCLHVRCRDCRQENSVPLGKRHATVNGQRKIWDINSKVAVGRNKIFLTELNKFL